jgi:hypothetical protein
MHASSEVHPLPQVVTGGSRLRMWAQSLVFAESAAEKADARRCAASAAAAPMSDACWGRRQAASTTCLGSLARARAGIDCCLVLTHHDARYPCV